ncbi:hypothetical protein BVRB_033850, partial [Beta vulgaris subsp. vulgaris]
SAAGDQRLSSDAAHHRSIARIATTRIATIEKSVPVSANPTAAVQMGNNIRKLRKDDIEKHYEIKEKLGTGSFAVVKRATSKKDGKDYAIKIVKKKNLNSEELETIHEEVSIMHRISHPNVVSLIEIFDTPKSLYMVLELLTGG